MPRTTRFIYLFLVFVLLAGCQPSAAMAPKAARAAELNGQPEVLPLPPGLKAPIRPLPGADARIANYPEPPIGEVGVQRGYKPLSAPQIATYQRSYVFTPPGPAFAWVDTENFLLLGTDRRGAGGSWRTDTIMVVGLDQERGRAAVLSIPRDLYVNIPGYGWGRINQADYLGEQRNPNGGGPALVSSVLSNTLGIATDHWVRVEMNGFVSFVDAVGGVTVHLDCPFYEPIFNMSTSQWEYFTLPAGDVYLDGQDAYWFVRLRLRESDIGRAKRQRQFLWALRDQALQANLLTRFPELWSAFRQTFSTDMSILEMVEFGRFGLGLGAQDVRAAGISLGDLESFRTDQGASVLRIADQGRVLAVVNGIWDAPAMADAYRQDATRCPAIPTGPPGPAPTPTPLPQAEQDPDQLQPEGEQPAADEPAAEQANPDASTPAENPGG